MMRVESGEVWLTGDGATGGERKTKDKQNWFW